MLEKQSGKDLDNENNHDAAINPFEVKQTIWELTKVNA